MKNTPRSFVLLAGLSLALMPAAQAAGQTQNSQPPSDELSVKQARRAIVSASKYAIAFHPATFFDQIYSVNPSSILFTLDSSSSILPTDTRIKRSLFRSISRILRR